MINKFRTLLLNLPYNGDDAEHIPPNFNGINLPPPLKAFYNLIFGSNTSRAYKEMVVHNLLNIIDSANLSSAVTDQDSRVTYSLSDTSFFKINRRSVPVVSDPNFGIFVYGEYVTSSNSQLPFDTFQIAQVTNTNKITIFSNSEKKYLSANGYQSQIDNNSEFTLTFTGNMSEPLSLANTGISVAFQGTESEFISTSNKTWGFAVESPYTWDFESFYNKLSQSSITRDMLDYQRSQIPNMSYENLWNQHFSKVYKIAGLLIAFVQRVNLNV